MKYQFLDQLSPSISLYYRGQSKHTSPFSITISILSYMALVSISIIFFYLFLQNNFVSAFYYNRNLPDTGIFYLNENQLFHIVAFSSKESYNPKILSVIGMKNMVGIKPLEYVEQSKVDHWIYEELDKSHYQPQTQQLISEVQAVKNVTLCVSKFYNSQKKQF